MCKEAAMTYPVLLGQVGPRNDQRRAALELKREENPHSFSRHYSLRNKVLGSGMSGSVFEAVCKNTGRMVAVKTIKKRGLSRRELANVREEIRITESLSHPNIVRLEGVYESETSIRIVMEKLAGGEAFERVNSETNPFTESSAAKVVTQLLHALAHLHEQGVVHRDVKLENLVYVDEHSDDVKLIDFGLAGTLKSDGKLTRTCGSPQYIAPEVLTEQPYDEKADLWSVGCTMYVALTGKMLYIGSDDEVLKKTYAGKPDFGSRFRRLPADAQDFIRSLLQREPEKRPSATEALEHPWLRRMAAGEALDETPDEAGMQSMSSSSTSDSSACTSSSPAASTWKPFKAMPAMHMPSLQLQLSAPPSLGWPAWLGECVSSGRKSE